jgi:hypothetical protein
MPFIKTGGVLPDSYGLSITVFAKEATMDNPIKAGTLLKFDTSAPYTAVKCVDGDTIRMVAKHDVQSPDQPLGVYLLGYKRNYKLPYTGSLAIGDSVVADASGGVKKAEAANGTFVAQVNADNTVEVFE